MISPAYVEVLSSFGPKDLARALATSGYTGHSFEDAKFLGINEDGHFAYKVTYYDDAGTGEEDTGNVYLVYDHVTDSFFADF